MHTVAWQAPVCLLGRALAAPNRRQLPPKLSPAPARALTRGRDSANVYRTQASRSRRCGLETQAIAGDIGSVVFDAFAGSPLKLGGTLGISYAAYATILYFRLQYILAAHVGNNVPPKARVVEYGIGTGINVYYYPPSTVAVYGVDPKADQGLLLQVGGRAQQTVTCQVSPLEARLALEANSVDAVVSVKAIGRSDKVEDILREAARVLKPGGRLVYFEEGKDGERLTQALKGSTLFKEVDRDERWATYFLAPHSIGLATRASVAAPVPSSTPGGAPAYQRPAKEAPRPKKGFASGGGGGGGVGGGDVGGEKKAGGGGGGAAAR